MKRAVLVVIVIAVVCCPGVLHSQSAKVRPPDLKARTAECKNMVDHGRDPLEAATNNTTGGEIDALKRCAILLVADGTYLDKIMDLMFMHGAAAALAELSTKRGGLPAADDTPPTAESLKESNGQLQAQVDSLKKQLVLLSSDNEVMRSRFNDMKIEYKSTLDMVGKMQETIGRKDASTCGNSIE